MNKKTRLLHRHSPRTVAVVVREAQKTRERRQVALERGGAEMLIHMVDTVEHGAEIFGVKGDHRREADRGVLEFRPPTKS